jgi:hypothetical protein
MKISPRSLRKRGLVIHLEGAKPLVPLFNFFLSVPMPSLGKEFSLSKRFDLGTFNHYCDKAIKGIHN